MDIEIKIQGISHRYNSQLAVNNVNFELSDRRITGLLGANGAGKSTLMNIICGALTPTEGDVLINGNSIRNNPVEAKKLIGFLPQKPPLIQDLTVEEFLKYAAELRRVSCSKKAVEEAMERCGITHFRKRLIKHLSGGYQQRVGLAQAIIHKPAFIVLDEPTNGLDPIQIAEVRKLIEMISKDCLVILSTHILQEVQLTCERILMMNAGHLIFDGSIDDFNNSLAPTSILLTFAQAPDLEALSLVDGVIQVQHLTELQQNSHHLMPAKGAECYELNFSGNSGEVSERIIDLSVEKGWHLQEIRKQTPVADDIFKYICNSPHSIQSSTQTQAK